MATLKLLSAQKQKVEKDCKKIKDLHSAAEYLQDLIGLAHNTLLFKQRNDIGSKPHTSSEGKTVYHLESTSKLENDIRDNQKLFEVVEALMKQMGNIRGFNCGDISFGSFMTTPAFVLKRGGSYNDRGYPVYDAFYFRGPRNIFLEEKPKGDAKGFYFHALGESERHYYYLFAGEESDEEQPQPGPSKEQPVKKTSKPKKAKPVPKLTAGAVGSSKVLLDRTGHGLSRLLAEARDPPLIEFKGPLEVVKGFRRRAEAKYGSLILSSSTTYRLTRDKAHRCLFEFRSVSDRDTFLSTCTLKLPNHRLGNFLTK